jgi:predicted DNA-binding transcriptional regulator AlpA
MTITLTPTELLTPDHISAMLEISREHFINRVSKRPDFPRPCLVLSQKNKRWDALKVQEWQQEKAREMAR